MTDDTVKKLIAQNTQQQAQIARLEKAVSDLSKESKKQEQVINANAKALKTLTQQLQEIQRRVKIR